MVLKYNLFNIYNLYTYYNTIYGNILVRKLERKIDCESISDGLFNFPQIWTCKLIINLYHNRSILNRVFAILIATYE